VPLFNFLVSELYELNPYLPPRKKIDMCELARNSCLQSGFELALKRHWLGPDFYLPGVAGNAIHQTNVPNVRVAFRHKTLTEELEMVSVYDSLFSVFYITRFTWVRLDIEIQ
jgi:AMP deaminase